MEDNSNALLLLRLTLQLRPAYLQLSEPLELIINRSKVRQSILVQLACSDRIGIDLPIQLRVANTGNQSNSI